MVYPFNVSCVVVLFQKQVTNYLKQSRIASLLTFATLAIVFACNYNCYCKYALLLLLLVFSTCNFQQIKRIREIFSMRVRKHRGKTKTKNGRFSGSLRCVFVFLQLPLCICFLQESTFAVLAYVINGRHRFCLLILR